MLMRDPLTGCRAESLAPYTQDAAAPLGVTRQQPAETQATVPKSQAKGKPGLIVRLAVAQGVFRQRVTHLKRSAFDLMLAAAACLTQAIGYYEPQASSGGLLAPHRRGVRTHVIEREARGEAPRGCRGRSPLPGS
ncbi:hypothetical protein Acsp03_32720 [Actinomadura sp. NBRC 104412]|nr:hypothetical protein Acsp03_32720 [Actinomadura sp. NBRC 104412]